MLLPLSLGSASDTVIPSTCSAEHVTPLPCSAEDISPLPCFAVHITLASLGLRPPNWFIVLLSCASLDFAVPLRVLLKKLLCLASQRRTSCLLPTPLRVPLPMGLISLRALISRTNRKKEEDLAIYKLGPIE